MGADQRESLSVMIDPGCCLFVVLDEDRSPHRAFGVARSGCMVLRAVSIWVSR